LGDFARSWIDCGRGTSLASIAFCNIRLTV
jgi:hypothetical protein